MKHLVFLLTCSSWIAAGLSVGRQGDSAEKGVERKLDVNHLKIARTIPQVVNASLAIEIAADVENNTRATPRLVWFLGCSLDSEAVVFACEFHGLVVQRDFHIEPQSTNMRFKWCTFHGTTLVFSFHPGTSAPPYDDSYYQFKSTTWDMIQSQAQGIQLKFGRSPDATIVDSSLWDVWNWWVKGGYLGPEWVAYAETQHWCQHDIPNLLGFVQKAFPHSRIAFRTPPPRLKDCGDPNSPSYCRPKEIIDGVCNVYLLTEQHQSKTSTVWRIFLDRLPPCPTSKAGRVGCSY